MKFKRLNLILFLSLIWIFSCRKPGKGIYQLTLTSKGRFLSSYTGEEYKVTSKKIYYSNGFSGQLKKEGKDVEGVLTIYTTKPASFTISVKGRIQRVGFNKHEITGTFEENQYEEGEFKIVKTREL